MAKEKITFSARKDPLLRPRPASQDRKAVRAQHQPATAVPDAPTAAASTTPISQPPPTRSPAGTSARRPALAAVEEPVGVISVPVDDTDTTRSQSGPPDEASRVAPTARSDRSRQVMRRTQTSMSLPPTTWDTLDALSQAAGASTGELLVAILTAVIPDSPPAALDAIEQLLVNAPDEGPREERNYRLPLGVRHQLDDLTKALGPSMQRSLLIRALLGAHTPEGAEDARKLITAHRIQVMRASANI